MFVAYGTGLESAQKKQSERFHGAFTGGFSAGYYNSVGSKEGWAPKSYVITRESKRPVTNADDFMDDEDRADFEDRVVLSYAPEFNPEYTPVAESAAQRMFQSSIATAGFKLLQSMGWKEGQGIGPAVKKSIDVGGRQQVVTLAPRSRTSGPVAKGKKDSRKRPMNLSIADDLEEDEDEEDTMFVKRSKATLTGVKNKVKVRFVGSSSKVKPKGFDGLPPLAGFVIREFDSPKVYKVDPPADFMPNEPSPSALEVPQTPHPPSKVEPQEEAIPKIDNSMARQALSGLVLPYRDDLAKQARYVKFLELSAESSEIELPANRDRHEWINELKDFCRSAQMFRPLSGAMANKFTSSGTFVAESKASPQEEAARTESYGPRTRVVTSFVPERLLCTRMHVSYHGPEKIDVDDFLLSIEKQVDKDRNESIEVNPERNEALEAKPAPPDMFKAVFGDGDVEEEL